MSNSNSSKQVLLSVIGIAILVIAVVGVAFAFFNYTRTGVANNIRTGRIYFNSSQNGTLNLTNIFPVASIEVGNDNQIEVRVYGDTTYLGGEEFEISLVSVNNTIVSGSTEKTIPVNYIATYTATPVATGETPNNIGTSSDSYFTTRGSSTAVYQLKSTGVVSEGEQVLIGYIPKDIAVDGTLTIKAYLDASSIAITDTYDETSPETDYNGTTTNWINDRTVLTTDEWNSLQNTPISFKVKVESNEGVWVEEQLTGTERVQRAITAKMNADENSCNPTWTDEDDRIIYFSGTNDCVDMNYVWYSGKLWRITAIYPDGAMKLITQNNITSITFNGINLVNFYTDANITSYMYQWLNEDFYYTLYNANNFIDTSKQWNATMPVDTTISTKPLKTNMVTANVGLLNNYEYYNSYRCIESATCTGSRYSTGYLNIGYYWSLLNPYNILGVWFVGSSGSGGYASPTNADGARPSIYLKSGLEFTGEGSVSNPYKIVGDREVGSVNELINTRLSGEYVKLDNGMTNQIFRIIGVEDNKTKIIAMDYVENKNTRQFATSTGSANTLWGSGATTDTDTWYTYLNTSTIGYLDTLKSAYGELFDSGTYYLGTSGYNYKLSVCANATSGNTKVCDKTSQVGTFNIGLPRYGEMFATQQGTGYSNSVDMWLMNRYSASYVWFVNYYGAGLNNYPTYAHGARPTVHLKSTVKILSGSGTESDPYVVGL